MGSICAARRAGKPPAASAASDDLSQHHPHDLAALRSQRHTNSNLARPPRHRVRNRPVKPDAGDQQRQHRLWEEPYHSFTTEAQGHNEAPLKSRLSLCLCDSVVKST